MLNHSAKGYVFRGQGQPFLREESDVTEELRNKATHLQDILARETFYRDLPTIEQYASAIEAEYKCRYNAALEARICAYANALDALVLTPGWDEIDRDQQQKFAAPFERGRSRDMGLSIPQLQSELDACEARLRDTIADVYRVIDGERVATVRIGSYFSGGVETEEQLDAALSGIREECSRLIGTGKKVIIQ
jgi:hypothetical protein